MTIDLKVEGNVPVPSRGQAIAKAEYARLAVEMQVNDYIKTRDKKTTTGLLRALDRLDRMGAQRTVDGDLWVWRIK